MVDAKLSSKQSVNNTQQQGSPRERQESALSTWTKWVLVISFFIMAVYQVSRVSKML